VNTKRQSIRQLAKVMGYSVGEVQRRRSRGESDSQIMMAAKVHDEGKKAKRGATRACQESFADAQARKESAMADLREMEAAQKRGELLNADEVREAVSGMVLAARAKFLVIGDVLADRCRRHAYWRLRRAYGEPTSG
jgi:hypothetical protein